MSAVQALRDVVKRLRAPGGCPWDREQTMASITPHIIEEAYELVEAIKQNQQQDILEELGDVLLHVVMLSEMAKEIGWFTLDDVAKHETDKMIRRHPHVFGEIAVSSVDEVWKNWEAIKKQEKANAGLLDSIPKSLPALLRALKIQKKVARIGFEWPHISGPLEKLKEEIAEFSHEVQQATADKERLTDEAGDVLFTLVNVFHKLGVNPEEALQTANDKFARRFLKMESQASMSGKQLQDYPLEELEKLWQQVKKDEA